MDDELYQKLLGNGFRFVSYRPRSEKEIVDFLEKKLTVWKTYAPGMIKRVCDRLAELGYIDDQRFVEWWVEQRSTYRPKGARRIAQELISKGIDKKFLEHIIAPADEFLLARQAIQKIINRLTKLPQREQKKKIYSYLGQRGFSSNTIYHVIDEFIGKSYNTEEDLNEGN